MQMFKVIPHYFVFCFSHLLAMFKKILSNISNCDRLLLSTACYKETIWSHFVLLNLQKMPKMTQFDGHKISVLATNNGFSNSF